MWLPMIFPQLDAGSDIRTACCSSQRRTPGGAALMSSAESVTPTMDDTSWYSDEGLTLLDNGALILILNGLGAAGVHHRRAMVLRLDGLVEGDVARRFRWALAHSSHGPRWTPSHKEPMID